MVAPELFIGAADFGMHVRSVYSDGVNHLTLYCNPSPVLLRCLNELSGWNFVYNANGVHFPPCLFWFADEELFFYGWAETVSATKGYGVLLSEFRGLGDKYLTLIVSKK